MESWFATLKKEQVHLQYYATRAAAKSDIFEYIEVFYNKFRRHSKINNVSPSGFRAIMGRAAGEKNSVNYRFMASDNLSLSSFLLTAKRNKAAAMRFFEKAIHDNGNPEKVTMDKAAPTNRQSIRSLKTKKFPSSYGR